MAARHGAGAAESSWPRRPAGSTPARTARPFTEHTEPAPISAVRPGQAADGGTLVAEFAAASRRRGAGRPARQPLRPRPGPRQAAGAGLPAVPGPADPAAADASTSRWTPGATTSTSTTRRPWSSPATGQVDRPRRAGTQGARERALDDRRGGPRRPATGSPGGGRLSCSAPARSARSRRVDLRLRSVAWPHVAGWRAHRCRRRHGSHGSSSPARPRSAPVLPR